MSYRRILRLFSLLAVFSLLASCNFPGLSPAFKFAGGGSPVDNLNLPTAVPELAQTLITFRLKAPADTPANDTIYLTVLDEVTGVALNSQINPMQLGGGENDAPQQYIITLPFTIGSLVKYRYERQSGGIRVSEHLTDGSPVRYRMYSVTGQGTVDDVVSRWTDTPFKGATGRITGLVTDETSGKPIPSLLVTAGGAQTLTASDGSFRLEGLPEGVHNLVVYALDGAYSTFQQGARVAAQSTTPATATLQAAPTTKVVFVVSVPDYTLPVVPLRLAGNLYQLGNSFANLAGGVSTLAVNMPVMNRLPDGRYSVTLNLPAGADVRYKYTLGDGFWNAEHATGGAFRLRQLIVPAKTTLVEDKVDTWYSGAPNSLTFDLHVPADTLPEDFVSIQFNPLIGWTEPVPMWPLGGNRWAYVLYSPLDLPGNFMYRYCRNGQCGFADDAQTPGLFGAGRPAKMSDQPQTIKDQVTAWANWRNTPFATIPDVSAKPQGSDFMAGVEFLPAYDPSWKALLPKTLDNVGKLGANWVVLAPTWSYSSRAPGNNPPVMQPVPGQDALWFDIADAVKQAQTHQLNVALYPSAHFAVDAAEWWASAPRDAAWWQNWFESYSAFAINNADLAQQSGASTLILGGAWLAPALPGGKLANGTPSGSPADAATRWSSIFEEIRNHFDGKLAWAQPYQSIQAPPPFLDQVDEVYLLLSFTSNQGVSAELGTEIGTWLDNKALPFQVLAAKPLVLAVEFPSNPDLQAQVDAYNQILTAANQRDWISGFVSRGYYPPAALQDPFASVNGKPASDLLGLWFPKILGTTP